MAEIQRTLSIIKPDATSRPGATGEILRRFEEAGLRILALTRLDPLTTKLVQRVRCHGSPALRP